MPEPADPPNPPNPLPVPDITEPARPPWYRRHSHHRAEEVDLDSLLGPRDDPEEFWQ